MIVGDSFHKPCNKHGWSKNPHNHQGTELQAPVCYLCLEELREFPEVRQRMLKTKSSKQDLFAEVTVSADERNRLDKMKSKQLLEGAVTVKTNTYQEDPRQTAKAHEGGMKFTRKTGEQVTFSTVLSCDSELFPLEFEYFVRPMENLAAMAVWQEAKAKAVTDGTEPPKPPYLLATYFWLHELHHLNDTLIVRQALQSSDWESLVCFRVDFQDALPKLTRIEKQIVTQFVIGYDEDTTSTRVGMRPWIVREQLKSANRSLRNSMKLYTKPLKPSHLSY